MSPGQERVYIRPSVASYPHGTPYPSFQVEIRSAALALTLQLSIKACPRFEPISRLGRQYLSAGFQETSSVNCLIPCKRARNSRL